MNAVDFDLDALTADFKQAMQDLYGDRLANVILYGSYARGDFYAESDVDFMVVLKDSERKRYAKEFLLYTEAYLRKQNLIDPQP